MTDGHDLTIVIGPGAYQEAFWQAGLVNGQRMVPDSREIVRDSIEQPQTVMGNPGELPVHDLLGIDYPAAKGLCNTLMAEAYSLDGDSPGEIFDPVQGDPGIIRGTRARRDDDRRRIKRLYTT